MFRILISFRTNGRYLISDWSLYILVDESDIEHRQLFSASESREQIGVVCVVVISEVHDRVVQLAEVLSQQTNSQVPLLSSFVVTGSSSSCALQLLVHVNQLRKVFYVGIDILMPAL